MNISDETDMTEVVWDGTEAERGVSGKPQNDSDPTFPQECVGNDVKGNNFPDTSTLNIMYKCSPVKEIHGTGITTLEQASSEKPRKKNSFPKY